MADPERDLLDHNELDNRPDEFGDNFAATTAEEIETHQEAVEEAMRGMMIDTPADLDETQPGDAQSNIATQETPKVEPEDPFAELRKTPPQAAPSYYEGIEDRLAAAGANLTKKR